MFGSLYDQECVCAECSRKQGKRTYEQWLKIPKVDYSILTDWRYMLHGEEYLKSKTNQKQQEVQPEQEVAK